MSEGQSLIAAPSGVRWTPQQNGVAERKNQYLLETARALLIGTHDLRHHWDNAIIIAVHLINCMSSSVLTFKTPLQVLAQHELMHSVLTYDVDYEETFAPFAKI
ncbi:hypothetical protein L3X38_013426 [Prunus dulcis]|uniref:Integrase catalytic domain-containing protein n=1 Tax=Prunus dulcis TaxID=3755 RepID=A0AAD4ZH10_PRUDU|nr:hypothetical protein L3X38_013426 [Prunus dulcis]